MSEVVIDEGLSPYGTRTRLHIATDTIIKQTTYDAEPILARAKAMREATEGQRWGEGKIVGQIPMAVYSQLIGIKDKQERRKKLREWLQANPAFVTFDRYLK